MIRKPRCRKHSWLPKEQDVVEGNIRAVSVHWGYESCVVYLGPYPGNAEHGKAAGVPGILKHNFEKWKSDMFSDPESTLRHTGTVLYCTIVERYVLFSGQE